LEAIKSLNDELVTQNTITGLNNCIHALTKAEETYLAISTLGLNLDIKSRNDHLIPIREGIDRFKRLAGLM